MRFPWISKKKTKLRFHLEPLLVGVFFSCGLPIVLVEAAIATGNRIWSQKFWSFIPIPIPICKAKLRLYAHDFLFVCGCFQLFFVLALPLLGTYSWWLGSYFDFLTAAWLLFIYFPPSVNGIEWISFSFTGPTAR